MSGGGEQAAAPAGKVSTGALESLFAAASIGVGLVDRGLRCVRANPTMRRARLLEDEPVVPDATRARVQHALGLVLETGRAVLRQHVEHASSMLVDFLPLRDELGTVTHVVVIANAPSDHGRTEAALTLNLTLAQIVAEISTSLIDDANDLDQAITAALDLLGSYLDFDRVALGQVCPDRGQLEMTHRWSSPRFEAGPLPPLSFALDGKSPMLERLQRGEELLFEDAGGFAHAAADEALTAAAHGFNWVAVFPLAVGRKLRGLLACGKQERMGAWPPELVGCLRVVAELIAGTLDRRRRELEDRRRYRFQALLSRLATSFIDKPIERLGEAIDACLLEASRVLDFEVATLYRLDEAGRLRALHRAAVCEDAPPDCADGRSPRELGWPWPVLMAGNVFIGGRDRLTAELTSLAEHYRAYDLRVLACAPIVMETGIAGVLSFSRYQRDGEPDVELAGKLRTVTDLFGMMLARAESEAARRRTYEELSLLKASIEGERDYLREEVDRSFGAGEILGNSPALEGALDVVDAVAPTSATVLLTGESGVGKELFARALHARSPRADRALVKVNCAAIPRELFESEFFGHVRGAFTGASKDRIGRFELAQGGTIFLDEVSEIPLELQSKLLRVLQEGELERVGDDRTRRVDVRVIAATNRPLEIDVRAGRFRADLFYRLSAFPIRIPPLRERREDIALLAQHFLQAAARATGRLRLSLDDAQLHALASHDWPGNVRELKHVIERAVILSRTPPLRLELVAPPTPPAAPAPEPRSRALVLTANEMDAMERDNLVHALTRAGWRVAGQGGAAALLGLAPSTLRDRMKVHGIVRPR